VQCNGVVKHLNLGVVMNELVIARLKVLQGNTFVLHGRQYAFSQELGNFEGQQTDIKRSDADNLLVYINNRFIGNAIVKPIFQDVHDTPKSSS
jgi:hypothetical protein